MPPKKRKTTKTKPTSSQQYVWLLQYEWSNYGENATERALYSTKEKAIEAFPDLMDTHSVWGDDWKHGLEGFGKEDEDNYLGFDCLVDKIGDDGGVLLTNKNSDSSDMVNVFIKRMQVDPPKEKKSQLVEQEQEDTSFGELCY